MTTVRTLKDEILLDCYLSAVDLCLDPDFIHLLASELDRRKLKHMGSFQPHFIRSRNIASFPG